MNTAEMQEEVPRRYFDSRLLPIPTQEIFFRPYVGMIIDFCDDFSSVISNVVREIDKEIGICDVPGGFRSLYYVFPKH